MKLTYEERKAKRKQRKLERTYSLMGETKTSARFGGNWKTKRVKTHSPRWKVYQDKTGGGTLQSLILSDCAKAEVRATVKRAKDFEKALLSGEF